MNNTLEEPFDYLTRSGKDAKPFEPEVVKNWYRARAFVLDRLGNIAFKPDDNAHLHVIIDGDTPLMLSLVRQVALTAHYINFDEDNENEAERRRTVITIVSTKPSEEILAELEDEACLGNLLSLCKYTIDKTVNKDSYIDIEIEVVKSRPAIDTDNQNEFLFEENDVMTFCNSKTEDELCGIDTRKAQYADRMYKLGELIDNLPAENIHDAKRYTLALNAFLFDKLQDSLDALINASEWEKDQIIVRKALSNIFCADCFESKAKSIELCREDSEQKESELWAKYNELLCKSEHARWVVEKLIMGFRPLNEAERFEDEKLAPYPVKRNKYRDDLKKDMNKLAHIDICSYTDLRRIDPNNMKYDSFLMLGIPHILRKVRDGAL